MLTKSAKFSLPCLVSCFQGKDDFMKSKSENKSELKKWFSPSIAIKCSIDQINYDESKANYYSNPLCPSELLNCEFPWGGGASGAVGSARHRESVWLLF